LGGRLAKGGRDAAAALSQHAAAGLAFAAAFVAMPRSALRWLALPVAMPSHWRCSGRKASPDVLVEERAQTVAAVDDAATCWCRWP
jgi:hypothetical protein